MREILFRGKTNSKNEWVYGDLTSHRNTSPKNGKFIGMRGIPGRGCGYECHRVNPDTIGQYTGLTDKNGKKIFEGDIVKLDKQLFKVVYECSNFGLGSNRGINYNPIINESKKTGSMDFWGCYCDNFVSLFELYWNFNDDENILSQIEIVGNIYDNPELLEVQDVTN